MVLLVAPALLGLAVGVSGAALGHRRMPPAVAARLLAVISVTALLSIVTATVLLASGLAARLGFGRWFAWCGGVFPSHDAIPSPVSEAASLALAAMAISGYRFTRRWQRSLARWGDSETLEVINVAEPFAYAVPGSPGRVVVSAGLLRQLDPLERRALLEHERAHLRLRHSRYLRIVGFSAAAFPLLGSLVDEIRYVTERWADEAAAQMVGSRQVVASAIARTALASTPANALGFGDSDVAARVQALVAPGAGRSGARPTSLLALAAVASTASMATQIHHVVTYLIHVCGLT